jgi:hypothetical protein
MTRDDVNRWLARYIEAWLSYEPAAIGDLFAESAEYRYHPWDEPVQGRDAIVADWLANRDEPGTYEAEYTAYAVDGDRAVAIGTSRYADASGRRTYHNVYVLAFDDDGRCKTFTEWFIEER